MAMMTHARSQQCQPGVEGRSDVGGESSQYLERLVKSGSAIEIPELAQDTWPAALYQVQDRGGVSVLVLRTTTLTTGQRTALLRFQFAQYVAAGFIDEEILFGRRLEYDAWPSPRTGVHSVAFSASSGRILATLDLRGTPSPSGATPNSYDRPLLPIEERFGWGVFNRLRLLPELPLDRIHELGRFAKNHSSQVEIGEGVRAAVEVCVGMARALTQALHLEVEAFIGEFEDSSARKHLEFLHTPMVVSRGGLPTVARDHHHRAGLEGRARYRSPCWCPTCEPWRRGCRRWSMRSSSQATKRCRACSNSRVRDGGRRAVSSPRTGCPRWPTRRFLSAISPCLHASSPEGLDTASATSGRSRASRRLRRVRFARCSIGNTSKLAKSCSAAGHPQSPSTSSTRAKSR